MSAPAPPVPPPAPVTTRVSWTDMLTSGDPALLNQALTVILTLAVVALIREIHAWTKMAINVGAKGTTPAPGTTPPAAKAPAAGASASTPTTTPATPAALAATKPKPVDVEKPSPESLMAAVQACQKDIKILLTQGAKTWAGTDELTGQAPQHALALKGVKEQVTDMSGSLKSLAEAQAEMKSMGQRLTGIEGILGILAPKISTMSGNLELVRQATDSHWKDVVKSLGALANAIKANHSHWEAVTEKNHTHIVDGVKEVIKKVTTCDYKSFKGMTKQIEQLGQELVASIGYLQTDSTAIKDNLYNLAVALASTSEQVQTVREYCERPPVPLMQAHDRGPPPPTYEAPTVISHMGPGDRRQLHLQTAIPVHAVPGHSHDSAGPSQAQSTAQPSVHIDLGEGRKVNIPLFR
ncbi:FCPF [Symbiodinium sp. CCMP2456]|nr:FCPF [Symbiodinium sp. CCMP2456]